MRKQTLLFIALTIGLSLPAWAATVRVKANGTPIRATAAADSEIVLKLDQGAVLELLDVARDWYKVRDPRTKKEGYVPGALVDLLPGDSSAAGAVSAAKGGSASNPGAAQKAAAPIRKPAPPPKPGEWRDKGFVAVSGLFQGQGTAFGYSFSPPEFAYAEQAQINTHHPLAAGPAFDAGAGMRVSGNLAIGGALSVFSKSSNVNVDGTVPHPLYINRDRAVSGTFPSPRTEVGLHLQATWVVPAGRRMLVSFAGGPSYIQVKQAIASGINLSTVYPYDTTAVTGASTNTVSKGGIGFNAGVDVGYYLTRDIGVGALVRFTRASVKLDTPGGTTKTNAGGVQAGIGVRIRLAPAAPKTPAKPPAKGPAKAPPPPVKK